MSNMQEKDKRIAELERKVNELEQTLISEKRRLREAAGAWRRKAQEHGIRRTSLREGYNADTGMHYVVYVVNDIPADLSIEFVLETLKESILPSLQPFQFRRVDYSTKYKGWLLEVERPLNVNMHISLEEMLLSKVYKS